MNSEMLFDPPKCTWKKPNWLTALQMYAFLTRLLVAYVVGVMLGRDSAERTTKYIRNFWQGLLYYSHTSIRVIHRNNVEVGKPYIYMSNHQSTFDIPAILGALPEPVRMIAKAELFNVPFLGKAMLNSGFVRIDRKDRFKAIKQLDEAKERLKNGTSIAIYVEGTRQQSTEIGSFKKGGFHVATQLGFPIVPVWIAGARDILPANSSSIKINQTITVIVGEPIDTSSYSKKDIPQLMELVRERMLALKAQS